MRCVLPVLISIHALLAESDRLNAAGAFSIKHFYPRSPCGERLGLLSPTDPRQTISIHALLAESDYCHAAGGGKDDDFYPRSPCGERLVQRGPGPHQGRHFYPRSPCGERQRQKLYAQRLFSYFYPRSPCGERLFRVAVFQHTVVISIHALLAESDPGAKSRTPERYYFYPRSPCGERPYGRINDISRLIFLSTLSLRRATSILDYFSAVMRHFYPRSPCGERHILSILIIGFLEFLSTLSLRRATYLINTYHRIFGISIHALLAESDGSMPTTWVARPQFLSTLSLRRATETPRRQPHSTQFLSTLSLRRATCYSLRHSTSRWYFYPRSPCGERLRDALQDLRRVPISIHALLAESDQQKCRDGKAHINFYPRSPCGERHQPQKRHLPAGYFYPRSPCGERLTAPLTNNVQPHFYPRSPCGERPTLPRKAVTTRGFLSTLSLRRATTYTRTQSASRVISIHALLAESDDFRCPIKRAIANFYPRSPCGERRHGVGFAKIDLAFLSTLSLRRATYGRINDISRLIFLSTLSLRRATKGQLYTSAYIQISIHALLAESDRQPAQLLYKPRMISIHALLAESDLPAR